MAVGIVEQPGQGAVLGKPLHTPAAWLPADVLARREEWVWELSPAEVDELIAAAKHAVATGKEIPDLTRADFPLPNVGPKLEQLARDVLRGRGFHLIRGFPVDRLSRQETVTLYYGFGTHWGTLRSQNKKAHVVGHIKDIGKDPAHPETRIYQTAEAQPWHTDATHLVSLLCLKNAKEGGLSRWASSVSIYNRILEKRPDLIEVLAQPFFWSHTGEQPPGKKPYYAMPILHIHQGHFTLTPGEYTINQAQAFPEVPRLTEKQREALAAINEAAEALHISYDLQPGDIQLLHNWTQLHTRTAFVDNEGWDNRRHLLRLWALHPEAAHPINPEYAESPFFGGVYSLGSGTKLTAPLDAE